MALKATICKADIQVADLDRNHFGDYALTLARHPSETDERMMIRLLAFALYADDLLSFGKGLSSDEEPALALVDHGGVTRLLIEVGLPDEDRLRKASNRSEKLVLIAYGRAANVWWGEQQGALARYKNLDIFQLTVDDAKALAARAERNMKFSITIQEGMVYLDDLAFSLRPLQTAA